jgi:hypothetical protein
MQLSNFEAKYHRNGVCGRGFYSCRFTVKNDSAFSGIIFTATVWPKPEDPTKEDWYYAITRADQPVAEAWRGDHFVDAIWDAIKALGDDVFA